MEPAIWPVVLEVRQRGSFRVLGGVFRYGGLATISDRGRVRKETFAPRAFRFAIDDPDREINLLAGHSFDRSIASRRAGSLTLVDADDALRFEARLPEVEDQPSYLRDLLLGIDGGMVTPGISPGFTVPPAAVVPGAEALLPEPGNPGVMIRTISAAVLYELSIVTRPAYQETEVELRAAYQEPDLRPEVATLWL